MTAEEQVFDIYQRFIAAYPNSNQQFVPTLENLASWSWSIEQHELRQSQSNKRFDLGDNARSLDLVKRRSVKTFSQMPKETQQKFLLLASLFPDRKVYATGSRVNGDFLNEDSSDEVIQMRKDLFKKDTKESDYDITFEFKEGETIQQLKKMLPKFGDLIKIQNNEHKILIPMWDFSRLPLERHNEVIELVKGSQWGKLMAIHNEYQLSNVTFCCDSKPAQRWFTWAVENQVIKQQSNEQSTD